MAFADNPRDRALRAIAYIDTALSGLHGLSWESAIEPAEYHRLVAMLLTLKADEMRKIGSDTDAATCDSQAAESLNSLFRLPGSIPQEGA